MSDSVKATQALSVWEYIVGYAPTGQPHKVTFYDYQDKTLYREVDLEIIGQHGWELVTVILGRDPDTKQERYQYFFKRDRAKGYHEGFSKTKAN